MVSQCERSTLVRHHLSARLDRLGVVACRQRLLSGVYTVVLKYLLMLNAMLIKPPSILE